MWKGKNKTEPYDLIDGTVSVVGIHIGRDTNYNRGRRTANFNERWNFNVLNSLKLHHGRLDEKGGLRLFASRDGFRVTHIRRSLVCQIKPSCFYYLILFYLELMYRAASFFRAQAKLFRF